MRRKLLCLLLIFLCTGFARAQQVPYPMSFSQPALPPIGTSTGMASVQISGPVLFDAQASATPERSVIRFDPSAAEVKHEDRRWVLSAGNVVLKDFGTREQDAHDALHLIHEMRLDEMGKVGTPAPVMEYWLSKGDAPHMPFLHQHILPLDPGNLRIDLDPKLNQWTLHNNSRTFFNFGSNEQDARQALDVIRRHGFTHVVAVGQGTPSMLVFTGDNTRSAGAATPVASGTPQQGIVQASYSEFDVRPQIRQALTLPRPLPPALLQGQQGNQQAPQPAPAGSSATAPGSGALAVKPVSPATAPIAEPAKSALQRITFDFRQAQVHRENDQYVLTASNHVLATFGNDEEHARQALHALSRYQLNEQCRIGGPQSQFTYYLATGKAPTGTTFGVPTYPVDPATLTIRRDRVGIVLAGKEQAFWRFHDTAEAQQALATIQKYKFDHVCHMGNGDGTGFTYLIRTR
jgi:hypothetical protein